MEMQAVQGLHGDSMDAIPLHCPNPDCPHHDAPSADFFVRHGSYQADCRPQPVQRWRCRSCRTTFSEQTFRADYRDRRPECNQELLQLLAGGVSLRAIGRRLGLDLHSV